MRDHTTAEGGSKCPSQTYGIAHYDEIKIRYGSAERQVTGQAPHNVEWQAASIGLRRHAVQQFQVVGGQSLLEKPREVRRHREIVTDEIVYNPDDECDAVRAFADSSRHQVWIGSVQRTHGGSQTG